MSEKLLPNDEQELVDMISDIKDAKKSIRIRGGGSRLSLGQEINCDLNIALPQMSGIVDYDPGALSLVVQAGTKISEIEQKLDEAGQRLAFEPMDHRSLLGSENTEPTIGGVVACGISGPRRLQVGACRDFLLGVRFVNGKGELIKNGGQVMKNVTGYDLVKFLCGSHGTLGVLTELSFKTSPKPEVENTLVISGLTDEEAIEVMTKTLGQPLDISGAAHVPKAISSDEAHTYLRIEGLETVVARRMTILQNMLSTQFAITNTQKLDTTESQKIWKGIRDVSSLLQNSSIKDTEIVWKISIKPNCAARFMDKVKEKLQVQNYYYDWSGGCIWLLINEGEGQNANANAVQIRNTLSEFGGHATLVKASAQIRKTVPVFQPEVPALTTLAEKVRLGFDPHKILNPGLMQSPDTMKMTNEIKVPA